MVGSVLLLPWAPTFSADLYPGLSSPCTASLVRASVIQGARGSGVPERDASSGECISNGQALGSGGPSVHRRCWHLTVVTPVACYVLILHQAQGLVQGSAL